MTRRGLQIALGFLWLLDGGLQLQPFMLGTGFAKQIIAPNGDGQPQFVAGPVHWAADVIAAHPVIWDVPFATVQLLIGLGLLVPRTARFALAASVPWALGVWFFGEGLAGLAGGHASLLTGAPGAAFLYGLLALAAWPHRHRPKEAPVRWLPLAWAVLWIGGARFQALPSQNSATAVASTVTSNAQSGPHWLDRLDASVGSWINQHGSPTVVALVVAEALIGLGAFYRPSRTLACVTGFVLALGIWVLGQNFGGLYTGQATDPNTGPLIALTAVALLGLHRRRSTSTAPKSASAARSTSEISISFQRTTL
jgi:hypothetical protein